MQNNSLMLKETLEGELAALLGQRHLTVTTAESCTGGLIAGAITNVPGVSSNFQEGIVTYSNEAKIKYLHVKKETLEKYGAVSEQTAREMTAGILKASGADVAVAVTGIAGPDGGTVQKPVGLVYIGYGNADRISVTKCHFDGTRAQVRTQTVRSALASLVCFIKEYYV